MFDIIAIDWGSVRFGMAFGSSLTGLVIPCQNDCYTKSIFETIGEEIKNKKITKILVGMPLTRQLKPTEVTLKVQDFILELKTRFDLEILTINERNTTQMALSRVDNLKNKHSINHNSAMEICRLHLENI
jgi:putative holliday junction resolvase